MLGTQQPQVLAAFYEKIIGRPAEMVDGSWSGWQVGSTFFAVGEHSEMHGAAKEPGRVLFNFETKEVKAEPTLNNHPISHHCLQIEGLAGRQLGGNGLAGGWTDWLPV